jgi:hypothetical protein
MMKGNDDEKISKPNLPDLTKIYEAISNLLELTIFVSKMNEEEGNYPCKDGDLRDWPQTNEDYSDEFKEEFE